MNEALKGHSPLLEALWKRTEQDMVRRERYNRIRRGVIVPATRGIPNVMARDSDGRWWPNKNFVKENEL